MLSSCLGRIERSYHLAADAVTLQFGSGLGLGLGLGLIEKDQKEVRLRAVVRVKVDCGNPMWSWMDILNVDVVLGLGAMTHAGKGIRVRVGPWDEDHVGDPQENSGKCGCKACSLIPCGRET